MTTAVFKPVLAVAAARDPLGQFNALVAWVKSLIVAKQMPGAIVGISGTDSILAFLICARAFAELGKADRVLGVHYGAPFPPVDKTPEQLDKILSVNPSYRWVARTIVPWLRDKAPGAQVVTDDSIDFTDDYQRWSSLMRSSLSGASRTEMLDAGNCYWVVGTRNATEQALGTYSNISGAVSLQPVIGLYKSEILKICAGLGVPQLAIDKSRQVDCDCGRYDLAADHIDEVDLLIKLRAGEVADDAVSMDTELRAKLEAFIDQQCDYAGFKTQIPYCPPK